MSPPTVIFESAELRVVSACGFGTSAVVVTFSSYTDTRTLDRAGFAEDFFLKYEIDSIHVICRDNDWYQYAEMPEALAAIRAATAGHARVVTYGSSMGAYAAIGFSEALGAALVIAISPQYSVDPRKVPWEDRWKFDSQRIRFLGEPIEQLQGLCPDIAILYDDRNPDRQHVELIRAKVPVRDIPISYSGHPAGGFAAEIGLLGPMVLDLIAGTFDPAAFQAAVKTNRRQAAAYYKALSETQPLHRMRLKLSLAERAVHMRPMVPGYVGYLAGLLTASSALEEAERVLRDGLALHPDAADLHYRLSAILEHWKRHDEAIEAAQAAVVHRPELSLFHAHLGRMLGDAHRLDAAAQSLAEAFRLDATNAGAAHLLSIVHHRRGHLDEATAASRAALALEPGNRAFKRQLCRLEIHALRRRKATQRMEEANAAAAAAEATPPIADAGSSSEVPTPADDPPKSRVRHVVGRLLSGLRAPRVRPGHLPDEPA